MARIRYEEMLPSELAQAREAAPLVYVPIGSTEYHGFHLPVGFDTMHAYALCLRAAEDTAGVVLPPTYWGTRGHEAFPGSLLLSEETVAALARDVLVRLAEQGYRLIVLFTGHYPRVQGELLASVARAHAEDHAEAKVLALDPFNLHPTDPHSEHAGRIETSVMLYLRPDLVHMERLGEPGALKNITGDCVDATVEYGKERFESALAALVRTVREALAGL